MEKRYLSSLKYCIIALLIVISYNTKSQTLPGTYTTSWAGNSFAPANNDYNFIQYEANSMFVEADGTIFTNGYFDEGLKEMGIYKDGLPIGKIPNSHEYSDGGAITTNGTYIWASVQEGSVRRYNKSNYLPSTAADFLVSNTSTVLSQNIVGGLAVVGSELFASDYTGNKIKVYSALNDGVLLRSWTVAKPLTMATDASGNIWVISYDLSKWGATRSIANIYCYSTAGTLLKTLTMPSDVEAKYIAINKASNELFVTDIGDNMQIRIYNNINTTPTLVQSFGTQGGILSGIKGIVAPLKFNVPNLVGVDGSGNIIVWANGSNTDVPLAAGSDAMGACVESYTRAGVRNWQMLGLEFVDMGTFDPATDGADLYTKHEHFTMDYSKPDGQQWTWKGWTLDRKKYKGDARLFNEGTNHLAPTLMKRINGKLFMYMTSMTSDGWWVYRFDNANEGEIAIPCGNVTQWENLWIDNNGNGNVDPGENPSPLNMPQQEEFWGRNVDDNGTIWFARITGGIYNYPVQSINSFGVPVYSPTAAQVVAMPAPFTDLRRINYDAATDVMYLTGYTAALPNSNGDWGASGRVLARYNNWSTGNRTAAYVINIPYNTTTNISTTSFIVEKDYIFTVGYASKGKVTVFNASTGALEGEMIPGANVGGIDRTGACDLRNSVAAFKKSTGEYLVTVEDDLFEKVLIYRWNPLNSVPLDLVSFRTSLVNGKPHLKWQTMNEVKVQQFEVESSTDGIKFSKIKVLASKGGGVYSTTDDAPAKGDNYYRLKMVDLDGKFEMSGTQVVNVSLDTKSGFSIYPNPNNGTFTISPSQSIKPVVVTIFDQQGRTVSKIQIKGTTSISISELAKGIYIIKAVDDNGFVEIKKLIKD